MTKEIRNAVIEVASGALLTFAVAGASGPTSPWVYLIAFFAGLGIGSLIASKLDTATIAEAA